MPPKRHLSDDGGNDDKRQKGDASREEVIRRTKERIAQMREKSSKELIQNSTSEQKPKPQMSQSLKEKIAATKARIQERRQDLSNSDEKKDADVGRGLNVELHPLLQGKTDTFSQPIDNPNINKVNKRGYRVNPYIDNFDRSRKRRDLQFNDSGKYIHQANEIRKQQKLAELKSKIDATTKKAGLEPDMTIGEYLYKTEKPPQVEWWDEPLLFEGNYDKINTEAISPYIQHPLPINAPWERHLPPPKPMYLTKKEMKRIRRNDRAEKYKEQQDRIKLGLEPAPPPKVKLSNLMSALTNEAIKDPTAVERRVRKEVEERRLKHEAANDERKVSKEKRHEKEQEKYARDLEKGYYTTVFIVDQIAHPSHRFKLDINAKQLNLVGVVLYTELFSLVIVEGSEKNIKFYKKLMLNRIKWTESVTVDEQTIDLSKNKCQILWEGQLKDLHFKKWSKFHADNEETAVEFLKRFSVESYWKEAKAKRLQ